jgi:hypothetical protein
MNSHVVHASCGRAKGTGKWKESSDTKLNSKFQQAKQDYTYGGDRLLCYESSKREFVTDIDWFKAKNHGVVPEYECGVGKKFKKHEKSPMTKGHLIASAYAMGDKVKSDATFTLTNIVPQFEAFSREPWKESEEKLISWGQVNCATANARMFIVVGTIPSTFGNTPINPRFFGGSGFSEFEGMSQLKDTYLEGSGNKEYRINVPKFMWTAACCTVEYVNARGQKEVGTQSIAFFRRNDPGVKDCYSGKPAEMMTYFKSLWPEMRFPRFSHKIETADNICSYSTNESIPSASLDLSTNFTVYSSGILDYN